MYSFMVIKRWLKFIFACVFLEIASRIHGEATSIDKQSTLNYKAKDLQEVDL
jgi:hypothetical protein